MNGCGYQQQSSEERSMLMDSISMVCPKPRRLGLLNPSLNDHCRPLRFPINHLTDIGDLKPGAELVDLILTKGYGGERPNYPVASSPPFYVGSPPSRASNPIVLDAQFGNEKITPFSPAPPSPSAYKGGGCVRMTYGQKPAAVRVEGFDCLSRERRDCSLSAMA